MSTITFSEIMEFYPEHNASVYKELRDACRHGNLIPFVGAGLSVFCGYKGWPNVLKDLAKFIYDGDTREKVQAMVEDGELLQAAQKIHDSYPRMLKELRKIIDYNKIKNCGNDKLYTSAVYVLPYLFSNGLVMTTNFDRVLEEVYDRCHVKFGTVVTPYEPDLLAQIRQSNPHCLFKLHGDIGPEIHDIKRLVFTQAQYDKAYADDGLLMQELPKWFQNKKLLFLGCSLAMDKTMEVLQRVTADNPGLDHYAILACRPEDMQRRCEEMGNLGISSIYYPDGRHEAVRVILERLLEDVNYSAYEELSLCSRKYLSESNVSHRFMYNSDYIEFVGREQELERLQDFCLHPDFVSWWAVTGSGGIGKSRLVYEFTNMQREDGWRVYWLNHNDYNDLVHWRPPVDKCIVVADDVQAHLQSVGSWLLSVSERRRSEKLRILLLERDGKDLSSARWAESLQSDLPYDGTISSLCYSRDFLELTSLTDDELKDIMADFAGKSGKPFVNAGYMDRLIQTLKKIDGDLKRPMYALAITDAWCAGNDPTSWNKEQVLDELIVRELKFYHGRLKNLSPERISKEMRSELETLLARSCLVPYLPLTYIKIEEYPKLCRRADKLDIDLPELLRQIGVVHSVVIPTVTDDSEDCEEREKIVEAVVLDCPDLVKEYLVLQQVCDKGELDLLLPNGWDNDPMQIFFCGRLFRDYPEKLEGNNKFWQAFFAGVPESEHLAQIYGYALALVIFQVPQIKTQAFTELERLFDRFCTNEDVAVWYAEGVFGLSVHKTLKERERSVNKLSDLKEEFPENESLAFTYGKGLVNLVARQELEDGEKSVSKLSHLNEQYAGNEEFACLYAEGLFNLSVEQELEENEQSIDKLRVLNKQYAGNEGIAYAYARGLANLTSEQDLEGCMQSVSRLMILNEQYAGNEGIAYAYAKGLVNLSAEKKLEERRQNVEKLRLLYKQYPENERFAVMYARGLFYLAAGLELDVCADSVEQLENLHEQFPLIEELAIEYVQGLVNLSFVQISEVDICGSIKKAEKLLKCFTQSTEIQLSYAQTQFNLTLKQTPEDLRQTVTQIRKFLQQHPDANREFQIALKKYLDEHPDHTERYKTLVF